MDVERIKEGVKRAIQRYIDEDSTPDLRISMTAGTDPNDPKALVVTFTVAANLSEGIENA